MQGRGLSALGGLIPARILSFRAKREILLLPECAVVNRRAKAEEDLGGNRDLGGWHLLVRCFIFQDHQPNQGMASESPLFLFGNMLDLRL